MINRQYHMHDGSLVLCMILSQASFHMDWRYHTWNRSSPSCGGRCWWLPVERDTHLRTRERGSRDSYRMAGMTNTYAFHQGYIARFWDHMQSVYALPRYLVLGQGVSGRHDPLASSWHEVLHHGAQRHSGHRSIPWVGSAVTRPDRRLQSQWSFGCVNRTLG